MTNCFIEADGKIYETLGKCISGYDSSKCKTPARNHTESEATDDEGKRGNKKSATDP